MTALQKLISSKKNELEVDHSNSDPIAILSQLTNSQNQAKNVMSDLNKLSETFTNSFHDIEGKVEQLSGQLSAAENLRAIETSEKIKLQSENKKINNRLSNLLEILPSGVVLIDKNGVVTDCNKVAIDILGRPLVGKTWLSVIDRVFSPQADDGHQVSLKDGRKIHIETKGLTPEPGQMIVLTDMTKTRQLQDKLSQQHKLSSMGKMIASLAHQIRTPLSAAMIYGSHINDSKLGQQQLIEFSSSLMERLKFMDRQIHDMLQFVRGEKKQKQKVKLHDFICRLNENISIHENVKIKNVSKVLTEINEKKLSLLANEDDLIGAVSNLIENALAASTSDQKVIINISLEKTNDKNPNKNGRYLFNLEVVDSGLGMAKEQQKLIFEPFYTTKSSGNGLGLSIVQGVVIEHGGQLSLKSELGNGSTFGIKIPLQVASSSRVQTNLKNELIDEVDING